MLTLPPSVSIYMELNTLSLQLENGKIVQDVFDKDSAMTFNANLQQESAL